MKTETILFCEALLHCLDDLPPALADAAEVLEKRTDLARPLGAVNELRVRVRSLSDKLLNQHAYLLIFGPLKSGKSTLMNAISGAYVSEVTSLPGYPALVFVQHASEPSYSVTRYNGRESSFGDTRVLHEVIADSHLGLAEQIHAAELRGEEFDPRRHFTEAVRRIDVKMPVRNLAESGTVLVDTPGLYSRMNFSYDLLTREFRDSAACAVFVVKTDNLFLEQVFAEFNQLLDLFSRIFLVVNVDSGKRDLQPDGNFAPSAESENPQRIIEAFKTLSMAAPLRRACKEGRVRIHAVDLLQAASAVLTRERRAESSPSGGGEAFDVFQKDLTEFLNSNDYTREFIRDSLRQSYSLCDEIAATCSGPEMSDLHARQAVLTAEIAALDHRLAAFDRLLRVDWRATFADARVTNAKRIGRAADSRGIELSTSLEEALDCWYASDESLKSLEQQYWNPLVRSAGGALAEETVRTLRSALATPVGGAVPTPETMIDLHTVGFDLAPIGRVALAALEVTDTTEPFRIPIKLGSVPVKKTLADWMLFRSAEAVAERLFGKDRTEKIAPEVKHERLPESSRTALRELKAMVLGEKFPDLPAKSARHLLEHYIERFSQGVIDGLQTCRAQTVRERADRQEPFDRNEWSASVVQALANRAANARSGILALAEKENALPLAPEIAAPVAFPVSENVASMERSQVSTA